MMNARHNPIGIDIARRTIALVQLVPGTRIAAQWALIPRTAVDWPTLAQRLAGVIRRRGFVGRSVVIAAPEDQLLTAVLDLPPTSSGAPLKQLARTEAARVHRAEVESLVTAAWELPGLSRHGEGSKWMTASIKSAAAQEMADAFDTAGLEAHAIDAGVLAMARAAADQPASPQWVTPLLRIGWDGATIAGSVDGDVVFSRRLETPESHNVSQRLESLGITDPFLGLQIVAYDGASEIEPALKDVHASLRSSIGQWGDELSQQVRQSIAYLAHLYPQAELMPMQVMGGLCACKSLVESAAGGGGIEHRIVPGPCEDAPIGALCVAMGLAMHTSAQTVSASEGGQP